MHSPSLDLIAKLEDVVGSNHVRVSSGNELFDHDATFVDGTVSAVVHPRNTNEVATLLERCHEMKVPVTARGAGTSLVGGPVPLSGGVVLVLDRLNEVVVDARNICVVAGAGAVTGDIQSAAAEFGFLYPPDPGSVGISTIGGNIACNAGGMCSVKYGVTADYVIGLTVVLADGSILTLGGKTRKRSSGYRLIQLFIGSEGTLGVVTEATLKLMPLPRYRSAAMIGYNRLEDAAEAVSRTLAAGHFPSSLEILDSNAVNLLSGHLPQGFKPKLAGVLLVEQDGNDEAWTRAELDRMMANLGGSVRLVAETEAEREALWAGRRHFGRILMSRRKNHFSEDVAVPIGAVPEMVKRVQAVGEETGLTIATVGHAGDGNLHPCFVFDDDERHLVGPAAERIFRMALELGGTISAEHGLGALKRDFSELEHGDTSIGLMRDIKSLLDPEGILNPHKIFPEGPADGEFLDRLPGWSV